MVKLIPLLAIMALFVGVASVAHAQGAAPTFDSANYDREVAENTAAGENIGDAVAATGGTGALTTPWAAPAPPPSTSSPPAGRYAPRTAKPTTTRRRAATA